ncbi:glycosyltransferase family 2 protein [Rudanella lutea]|uniref:glycosyltransferase family 2 protein n=1 Tax=Rudanella lutea TaxID=451374 RepID=UPI0003612923|nr:glycosyltransferase family 2 protein [Rudanella lutea]
MTRLALVILNYNGQTFLQQFLPLVLQHADGHPVFVADNASTDGSVAYLQANFPGVTVVRLTRNTGYAGGYNEALEQIRQVHGGATYYALVNSDIEPTAGWIEPILRLMDANPRVAACQPKIRDFNRRDLFEHAGAAGGYIDYLGYVFCRGRVFATFEPDRGQYNDNRRVFWATGACLVVRADVFHQSGGFDAHFFAHMEEIDWCWRIQRLGYEAWACGESTVYHVGGGTLPKVNPHKTYLNYRNSLYMLYKNLPSGWLWPKLLFRLVLDGLSSVLFLKQGQIADVWAIIRAHFAFYGHLPTLARQRRALKPQQQLSELPVVQQSIVWQYFANKKKTYAEVMD